MRRLARWVADRWRFAADCELWQHYNPDLTFKQWREAGGYGAHLRLRHEYVPVNSALPRMIAEAEAKLRHRVDS